MSLHDLALMQYGRDPCSIGKVVKGTRTGIAYTRADVYKTVLIDIENQNYFSGKAKKMTSDVQKATESTNEVIKEYGAALDKFLDMEKKFVEQTKKTVGNVRDSAEKLSQGLSKVEKAADFNRLERYVSLLERAASAMTILHELEKTGKLEKIAGAIR